MMRWEEKKNKIKRKDEKRVKSINRKKILPEGRERRASVT
jgi:hypothetical protein